MTGSFLGHVCNSFENYRINRVLSFVSAGKHVDFIILVTFISHGEKERIAPTEQREEGMQFLNPKVY